MQAERFTPYGPDHLAVIALLCLGAVWLVAARKRLQPLGAVRIRRILAAALLGHGLYSWWLPSLRGGLYVPFQLCDLVLLLTVAALWDPRPLVAELVYFWGLSGSLQAILTPALEQPFPSLAWFAFFIDHLGIVLTAIYLAVAGRARPTHGSVWRSWALLNIYAAAAGTINWLAGTNYGFLARKPAQPSLLDWFGPWPFYIVALEGAALLSLYLCYAPFAWGSRE